MGAIAGLAGENREVAGSVLSASGDLSRQAAAMREELGRFLAAVKAA